MGIGVVARDTKGDGGFPIVSLARAPSEEETDRLDLASRLITLGCFLSRGRDDLDLRFLSGRSK